MSGHSRRERRCRTRPARPPPLSPPCSASVVVSAIRPYAMAVAGGVLARRHAGRGWPGRAAVVSVRTTGPVITVPVAVLVGSRRGVMAYAGPSILIFGRGVAVRGRVSAAKVAPASSTRACARRGSSSRKGRGQRRRRSLELKASSKAPSLPQGYALQAERPLNGAFSALLNPEKSP